MSEDKTLPARLRANSDMYADRFPNAAQDAKAAADELDRLRSALKKIASTPGNGTYCAGVARAALNR